MTMHPKAAQLALAGFRVFRHIQRTGSYWRVKRGIADGEPCLYCAADGRYHVAGASIVENYIEIRWGDAEGIGTVPQEMIEELIHGA